MRPGRRPFRSSHGIWVSDPDSLKPLANLRHLKWRDLHMIEDKAAPEFVRRGNFAELWALLDVREAGETDIARNDQTTDNPGAGIPARAAGLDASQAIAVSCDSGARRPQTICGRSDLSASSILRPASTQGHWKSML